MSDNISSHDREADVMTGVVADVVAELSAAGGYARTTKIGHRERGARFERFRAAHGVAGSPVTEDQVLAYLQTQPRPLDHDYAKSLVTAIDVLYESENGSRLSMPLVRRYLQAIRKDPAARVPRPKISIVEDGELASMLDVLAEPFNVTGAGGRVMLARAALSMARALHPTARTWKGVGDQLQQLHASDPALGDTTILASDHPVEHHILRAFARNHTDIDIDRRTITTLVQNAARRGAFPRLSVAGAAALDDAAFAVLLAQCDPTYARRVRDLAYLTLGLSGALRHISLAHLDIADVRPSTAGFDVVIRQAKLTPGAVLTKRIDHLETEPGTWDLLCPACALQLQLEQCARQGRTNGPVLATRYAGEWKTMTRQNGRLRVAQTFLEANGDTPEGRRIATRTLRRTAATYACRAGMPFADIAAYVTNQVDQTTLMRYIHADPDWTVHPSY